MQQLSYEYETQSDFLRVSFLCINRDSVRSESLYMKKTIECFLSREWSSEQNQIMVRSMIPNNNNTHEIDIQQQDRDIILFLAQMHRESKKIRPMTCAPHTICVQSGYA